MPISSQERETLLMSLQKSTAALKQALSCVPAGRVSVRANPDCWSPLEIIEHVAIVDRLFSIRIAGAQTSSERMDNPEHEADLVRRVRSRETHITAPEISWPKSIYMPAEQAIAELETNRSKIAAEVESTSSDLKAQRVDHPRLGQMSAFEAYLVIAAHGERHAEQIAGIADSYANRSS